MKHFIHIAIYIGMILTFSPSAMAQTNTSPEFAINLASDHVDITTSFSGSQIILYGSKPANTDLAVTLLGPSRAMIVRKKEQMGSFWINMDSLLFHNVPTYYDYAVSKPETALSDQETLASLRIGLNALNFAPSETDGDINVPHFEEALVRNKQRQNLFPLQTDNIEFINENFFKVVFNIPPQLPTGPYLIEAFLFRDGELINRKSQKLVVAQRGINARLSDFAESYGPLYGLFAIFIALFSGWAAYQAGLRK